MKKKYKKCYKLLHIFPHVWWSENKKRGRTPLVVALPGLEPGSKV